MIKVTKMRYCWQSDNTLSKCGYRSEKQEYLVVSAKDTRNPAIVSHDI